MKKLYYLFFFFSLSLLTSISIPLLAKVTPQNSDSPNPDKAIPTTEEIIQQIDKNLATLQQKLENAQNQGDPRDIPFYEEQIDLTKKYRATEIELFNANPVAQQSLIATLFQRSNILNNIIIAKNSLRNLSLQEESIDSGETDINDSDLPTTKENINIQKNWFFDIYQHKDQALADINQSLALQKENNLLGNFLKEKDPTTNIAAQNARYYYNAASEWNFSFLDFIRASTLLTLNKDATSAHNFEQAAQLHQKAAGLLENCIATNPKNTNKVQIILNVLRATSRDNQANQLEGNYWNTDSNN